MPAKENKMKPDWLPDLQWAWEFLRRNPEYQKDYLNLGEEYKKREPEREEGILIFVHSPILPKEIRKKYKLQRTSAMPPPDSKHPFTSCVVAGRDVAIKWLKFDNSYAQIRKPERNEKGKYVFPAVTVKKEGIIGIYFDIELPVEVQIYNASLFLRREQKRLGIITGRSLYRNYQIYLRLLDANAAGQKYTDIANELFPGQTNAANKASKMLKAAKIIRDESYYLIAARTEPRDKLYSFIPKGK